MAKPKVPRGKRPNILAVAAVKGPRKKSLATRGY